MSDVFLAKEFSRHPAGRYKKDGPYSGELFREKYLIPAVDHREAIVVHLDGARGYGSSFLEEAFGGLVRMYSKETVEKFILLDSRDDNLLQRIKSYMQNAKGSDTSPKTRWFGV
ncbi:DUF4325 domain-containing protein [Pseudomonas sp. 1239]|uniref:STAS-like domain-containing protein n=1 Tax=Pseudomonas sp. 1239 TaxID=1985343 RepID=UPI000B4F82A8|nr:STAS-like domain-containing protein [Pseudomonas sp. 1239]OUM27990.1 DUF4325 domain-containing protein [Pseudomonas sp. 1239]